MTAPRSSVPRGHEPSPLEVILCSPKWFGLVQATREQRAICRITDGWSLPPEWLEDATVQAILGRGERGPGLVVPPTGAPPAMVLLIAAIRTFKSLFAAAVAIRSALWSDLDAVIATPGEASARVPILSNERGNARAVFEHLAGKCEAIENLRRRIRSKTSESIVLERDDGRLVELLVVAARPGGTSLVSRWLAAAIFDEVTFMLGEDDGAASLAASLAQTANRMVPGGQVVGIGASYAPPRGPAYDLLMQHWGAPTPELVALWATGPELNPVAYSTRNCRALLRSGEDKARAYLTRSFRDPSTGFVSQDTLEKATRRGGDVAPEDGHEYVAASDPATRTNAWTLVVLETLPTSPVSYRIVVAREWKPREGAKLKPREVMAEIGALLRPYGCDTVHADQYSADALSDLAEAEGLVWRGEQMHGAEKAEAFLELERLLGGRLLELPDDSQLRKDLLGVRKRVNQDSSVSFTLSKTPDGRHCDYVPSVVRAVKHAPDLPVERAPQVSEEDRMWAAMAEHDAAGDDLEGAMVRLLG